MADGGATIPATPRVKRLRRYLVAGLLVWLPLLVTVFVIKVLVNLMDQTLLLIPAAYRPDQLLGFRIPGLGIVLTFVLLLVTGMLAANFVGRRFVEGWESLLARIPHIRSVYSGVKHMTEQVVSEDARSFRQVVLVEFPRKGMWSVAFLTADFPHTGDARIPLDQVCIFLPTTPNPTTGFLFLVPRDEIVKLDLPVDETLKFIMSLGVLPPVMADSHREGALAPLRDAP
jgi:uncharacterized membrane protein